jgi:hypothetical protein
MASRSPPRCGTRRCRRRWRGAAFSALRDDRGLPAAGGQRRQHHAAAAHRGVRGAGGGAGPRGRTRGGMNQSASL